MKIEIIKAYKSEDECIFEKEADAINQNINICIDNLEHCCQTSDSDYIAEAIIYSDIKRWFRDHPKDVRYILANINKIKDLIED